MNNFNNNTVEDGVHLSLPFHHRKPQTPNDPGTAATRKSRIPWPSEDFRKHFIAMCGEFVGTVLFLFFAFSGAQVALFAALPPEDMLRGKQAPSDPSQIMYIALCFGFSLAVNAWVFSRISGGLFNPAVTLGMCVVGALPYFRGVLLATTQFVAGIVAAALVSAMFPGSLKVESKLLDGTSITRGLFIEVFITSLLMFTIFMLAAEKHKGTFIAPIGIGLALFVAELTGVYYTGGSCNPARSFGPAVVNRSFPTYHWIYWLGPVLGALLASAFFKFMKYIEYETGGAADSDDTPDVNQANKHVAFAEHAEQSPTTRKIGHGAAQHSNEFSNCGNDGVSGTAGMAPGAIGNQTWDVERGHRRIGSDDTLGAGRETRRQEMADALV